MTLEGAASLYSQIFCQRQRPKAEGQYLRAYSPEDFAQPSTLWELFQISIFKVSETWEKDQEEGLHNREPEYHPTAHVMLTRFIKLLAWRTIVRADSYPMAVAFGSCLFTYPPREICHIMALYDEGRLKNIIPRVKKDYSATWIKKRFSHVGQDMTTEPPDEDEYRVVQDALEVFTPWGTDHFPKDPPVLYALDNESIALGQHMHGIMCTKCAGVEDLVEQWNAARPEESLPAPARKNITIPKFHTFPSSGQGDADPFDPPVDDDFLNDLRISIIDALRASSQRRSAHRFQLFRVCVDGEEQGRFAGVLQTTQSLRIPLDTICVEVFGQDDEGEVPLAVFYLPDLDESAASQPVYHVTESGATLALTVWPVQEARGDITSGHGTVEFWTEEALVPKTAAWYEATVTATLRRMELARITGDTKLETDLRTRLSTLQQAAASIEWQEVLDQTARTPEEVSLQEVLTGALHEAQARRENAAWRERLEQWQAHWAGRAEAAVRVVIEAPGKAAYIVTEGLEALVRPGGIWQFTTAPAQVRDPRSRERATPAPSPVAWTHGRPQAQVAVRGEPREVEVRVYDWPSEEVPPLVLLVATQARVEPLIKEPERQPQLAYLIARFEGVVPGDYVVAFEPLERSSV